MATAASVKLLRAKSYTVRGYHFAKTGATKIITKPGDIAYFKNNSAFQVKYVGPDGKPLRPGAAPQAESPRAAPHNEGSEDGSEDDTPDEGEEAQAVLPWRVGMKKAELVAAANSRNIAVTEDDRVPDIIQLLKEWDEQNKAKP